MYEIYVAAVRAKRSTNATKTRTTTKQKRFFGRFEDSFEDGDGFLESSSGRGKKRRRRYNNDNRKEGKNVAQKRRDGQKRRFDDFDVILLDDDDDGEYQ